MQCPDRKGIVAAVANFIAANNGNILETTEHQEPDLGLYMMRIEWSLTDFKLSFEDAKEKFAPIAEQFQMKWRLNRSTHRPRVAVMVSKSGHCLADLLYRHHIGELACDIPLVISNHDDQRQLTEFYKIPYHVVRGEKDTRHEAESRVLELLAEARVEYIVLARYMQILSDAFITKYPNRIINIHHSFLPAFIGAKPYHRSFERGVKLIGATSHFVTAVLDEGPIIDQDIIRISHRDTLADMTRKGGDIEKIVLSRAVRWVIENRVMVYGNKTAVFA